jgi:hypothetical protein
VVRPVASLGRDDVVAVTTREDLGVLEQGAGVPKNKVDRPCDDAAPVELVPSVSPQRVLQGIMVGRMIEKWY